MKPHQCVIEDCKLNKNGTCMNSKSGHQRCRRGVFETYVTCNLGKFGTWRIREFSSDSICATLSGRTGRVEFWGGMHKPEVWYIEKGTKEETLLLESWHPSVEEVCDAVSSGCSMAHIQMRLL